MDSQINWYKDATGAYTKTLRGYSASIVINANGTATLTIAGPGAPSAATYATRKAAKNAFRTYLFSKPVS